MRKRNTILEESATNIQSLYQNLAECCPLPMFATQGEEHILLYANQLFCRLSGKQKEALVGRSLAEAMPECRRDGSLSLFDRAYRTGKSEYVPNLEHPAPPRVPAGDGGQKAEERKEPDPALGQVYRSYAVWAVRDEAKHSAGLIVQMKETREAILLSSATSRQMQGCWRSTRHL